jgi:hypothetical protein
LIEVVWTTSLKAGYGVRRHAIGNEVLFLWEWLPATIDRGKMPLPQG